MSEDYQAPFGAEHPITPPPEMVMEWARYRGYETPEALWRYIATQAARWGSDQELRACCVLMDKWGLDGEDLVECRRPKPPSLAVKALAEIQEVEGAMYSADLGCDFTATRRALERLQELESND